MKEQIHNKPNKRGQHDDMHNSGLFSSQHLRRSAERAKQKKTACSASCGKTSEFSPTELANQELPENSKHSTIRRRQDSSDLLDQKTYLPFLQRRRQATTRKTKYRATRSTRLCSHSSK